MPVPLLAQSFDRGIFDVPYLWTALRIVPWLAIVYFLKQYFGGTTSKAERVMHSKVVIVTVRRVNTAKDTY